MDLKLTAREVSISPGNYKTFEVAISDIKEEDVILEQFTLKKIIDYYTIESSLDEIGIDTVIDHFGLDSKDE